MRCVVLGGAGDVGSRAVEDLSSSPGVEQVTIADRAIEAAERLAARLGGASAKVVARAVDATDIADLTRVVRGHDVAASALGPFHRFEAPAVTACLEAGVDYASVCDEYQAADEVIERFDDRARQLGRTAITGLGVSPGLTNLIARHFHDTLEPLERVRVAVYQPLTAGGGEAVLRHMLFIMQGDIAVWRGGARRAVRALGEQLEVEFPRFGRIRTWNMGHAEPVTLPRFLPGLAECEFFMGYGRGARLFVEPARRGLFSGARRRDAAIRLLAGIERVSSRLGGARPPDPGAIRVDLWGKRGGAAVHEMVCGVGTMRDATGLSLSIGARMLGTRQGLTKTGGVLAPEACLDPRELVRLLADKGIFGYRDLGMTERFVP